MCAGRARGYQFGLTTAFSTSSEVTADSSSYVSGVSITHGQDPRRHIWSFATGVQEGYSILDSSQVCPCANPNPAAYPPPSFVGNNYFVNQEQKLMMVYSCIAAIHCGMGRGVGKPLCVAPSTHLHGSW